MPNFYTEGLYYNGDGYREKHDTREDMERDAEGIKETEKEYIRMGKPKEYASSVVQYVGLQLIEQRNSND